MGQVIPEAPGGDRALVTARVEMVPRPLEAPVGEELTILTERKPRPLPPSAWSRGVDNGWPQA